MSIEKIKSALRFIPDYPKRGINFVDITPVLQDNRLLEEASNDIYEIYKGKGITKVLGIESRGFILGSIVANKLNTGFVPIRKKGKLPAETIEESYEKEYGSDTIEIHKDAISKDDIILIHDDLLATGGTMIGAINLAKKLHPKKIYVNFMIELKELNGRSAFQEDIEISSLLSL